jgi:D-aminoacyl-tRNA deacylase
MEHREVSFMIGICLSLEDAFGRTCLEAFKEVGFEGSEKTSEAGGNTFLRFKDFLLVPLQDSLLEPRLDLDAVASEFSVKFFAFASKHSSKTGTPCFTVHSTGNFGTAELGGEDRRLQETCALPKQGIFRELKKNSLGLEVFLEATHHGPTRFETPLFFVEAGSSEKEWGSKETANEVVKAILAGAKREDRSSRVAIGFGGGHYCPKFTQLEASDLAFSHVCAKYALDCLDEELVGRMIAGTSENTWVACLDSVGKRELEIKSWCESKGLEIIK